MRNREGGIRVSTWFAVRSGDASAIYIVAPARYLDRMTDSNVSVVMPCRNARDTVERALASMIAQTLTAWELIAVDDGSTDGTRRILDDAAGGDHRIRVMPCEGRGIVDALNTGLAAARTPWIARMDADDESLPDRLADQMAFAQADGSLAVVGCRVELFPADSLTDGMRHYGAWLDTVMTSRDIAREIYVESPLPHPSVMFRRDVVQTAGGYRNGPFPEDYDLWLRLHRAGHNMAKVPKVLLRWREGATRLSRNDDRYSPAAFLALKAHHIALDWLAGRQEVQVWGAGPDARRWRSALSREGIRVARFFDVDPRKIGRTLGDGAPVLDWRETPAYRDTPLLCAVGQKGARERMRRMLDDLGFQEGVDYLCVQ
jgi:glycosyltransferase involved in cell wall biosynthesis